MGAAGDKFCAKAYDIDPTKPIGSTKEAWEAAKVRAARILKGEPDSTAALPLSRSKAHGSLPDAECGSPHRQGCEDRGMEHGDNGKDGRSLRTLHFG